MTKDRKRKIIKKFRKSRFNYSKFVKDFYLEDSNAYISVKVNSYEDIISNYSLSNYEWLNKELADFIEENAYYIPIEYKIVLEVCGKKFNNDEKNKIIKAIKTYFGLKLGDKELDLKTNIRKQSILLLCGLLSLILLIIISKLITTFLEPFLVLFWFFMWEYIDVAFLEKHELNNKKTEAGQLANIEIIFNEENL